MTHQKYISVARLERAISSSLLDIEVEKLGAASSAAKGPIVPHVDVQVRYTLRHNGQELVLEPDDIRGIVDKTWRPNNTETSYQPNYIDFNIFKGHLSAKEIQIMNDFGQIAKQGNTLMHQKLFQEEMAAFKDQDITGILMKAVNIYKGITDNKLKVAMARALNDTYIAVGWVEKYGLNQHYNDTGKVDVVVPRQIAQPYKLLAILFGNHPEFTYYNHYVGASCSNMENRRQAMKDVDFNDRASIVRWVKGFKALYDVQDVDDPKVLESDRYFRFVHLAMEMIWSEAIPKVMALFAEAKANDDHSHAKITEALELVLKADYEMNQTFKSLTSGSDPQHYNSHIRPFIAGTWGRNLGSVYHERGKFFEGCGDEIYVDANGAQYVGSWQKHIGQTGAGTSVRPIVDEFAGGVSDTYRHPISPELCLALMCDDQATVQRLAEENKDNPLSFMLTMFRGVTRPYSHNEQIKAANDIFASIQPIIDQNRSLKRLQLRLQIGGIIHRIDHYRYVQRYINEFPPKGGQLQTAATGGSNTNEFLPDLIESNVREARKILDDLCKDASPDDAAELALYNKNIDEFEEIAIRIRAKTNKIKEKEDEKAARAIQGIHIDLSKCVPPSSGPVTGRRSLSTLASPFDADIFRRGLPDTSAKKPLRLLPFFGEAPKPSPTIFQRVLGRTAAAHGGNPRGQLLRVAGGVLLGGASMLLLHQRSSATTPEQG